MSEMDDLIGIPFLRGLGGDADTVLPQENMDMDMMGARRALTQGSKVKTWSLVHKLLSHLL